MLIPFIVSTSVVSPNVAGNRREHYALIKKDTAGGQTLGGSLPPATATHRRQIHRLGARSAGIAIPLQQRQNFLAEAGQADLMPGNGAGATLPRRSRETAMGGSSNAPFNVLRLRLHKNFHARVALDAP